MTPPLPEAWTPPPDPDARAPIDGDVVRKVAGRNVHHWNDRDWLSTGTVLTIMGWGNVSHVPAAALEYGGTRGKYVGWACDWFDAGTLDWASLDPRLRPYVEAYQRFCADEVQTTLASETLVTDPATGAFGYLDRKVFLKKTPGRPTVIDLKTGAVLGKRERYQVVSYCVERETAALVQLKKDGRYEMHGIPEHAELYARWRMLCEEAHEWIAEQERR